MRHLPGRKSQPLIAVIALVGVMALSPASPASASPATTRDKLQTFWAQHGVSQSSQAKLLKAFDAGQMPDSVTGGDPVKEVTQRSGNYIVTTETYADGSVSESKVEAPAVTFVNGTRLVRPMAISGCSTGGTSGHITYSNCYVSANNAIETIGFQATFTYVQGGYDIIENKGKNSYQQCVPSQCSDPKFDSWRQYETASAKAYLKYRYTYTLGVSTGDGFLTLNVGNNSASTKFQDAAA